MKKIYFLVVMFMMLSGVSWGQVTIAAWTYPTTSGNAPNTLAAECGAMQASSNFYADGTNGSDNWTDATSRQYFAGQVPAASLCSVTTATGAYSLVNSPNAYNGKAVVFKISTSGYQGIKLNYDTRGTATGFTTHEWLYSTNGSTFTTFATITGRNATSFSNQNVDFSAVTAINNLSIVYIKLVLSGASSTGNNRLDNVNFTGTATGLSTPPTLTATAGATVDNPFNVTFTDDATWRAAITGVKVGATSLTAGYSVSAGQIAFTPSASNPAALLQTAASPTITVSATGYNDATVTQAIGAGTATKLAMKTQPAAPAANGGVLATQPAVYIQDQYGNTTSSTATVDAAVGSGTWTLGGTTSVAGIAGTTTYSGLTATSASAVTGATIAFSSTGLTGVTSGTFDIPAPAPTITASVATLTGFTYSQGAGPSTEKNFVVSGLNLTADISITPPTDYEISTGTGGSFVATNPITLTQTGGTVTNTTIYVRLKAGLVQGAYNLENIDISSTPATSKTVACSGDVTAALAALPLFENFSYTTGTTLTANGWTAHNGAGSSPISVGASTITYPGYLSSGIGNEVSMTTSGEDVNTTFTAQTTGSVYASCLVNVTSSQTNGDYILHFGSLPTLGNIFQGRIFVKKDASTTNFAFGVSRSSTSTISYTGFNYVPGTTYLVVLKYTFNTGTTTDDIASLFVNPVLNAPEPAALAVSTDNTVTDLPKLDFIALRQGTAANAPALKLDGIRISTIWADIVGAIPAPTITLGTNPVVCQGTTTANLTYSATVGFPDQYSIDYDAAAEAAGFVDVVNASLPASPIVLTVPGAAAAGTYNAAVSVRNSSTGLASGSYSITITVSTPVDWANLQWPASGTICPSGTYTAYGRVYKAGVTPPAGAPVGITAELGYSTTNSDPSTWTNWQPATYNVQVGNDDEFMSTLSGLLPGTYYYAFRYQSGACSYQYGGFAGGFWNGTSNVSGVLTVTGTSTLAASATCQSLSIGSGTVFTDGSCNAIARLVPSGASPVSGTVNSCVTVDATVQSHNGSPYVQRHFDIEPATNAATATGTVTLYVLQSEFDAYNLVRGALPSLPVSGSNADPNVSNIRITQYHGTGTAPGNYSGTAALLTPSSVNWNGNYWEITVSVNGFSGFYVHSTIGGVLPVNLLTFSGHKQGSVNKLIWTTVSEQNNRGFAVERSSDGINYTVIGFVNTQAVNGNSDASLSYSFTDANPTGSKQYYRLRQQDINGISRMSNVIVIKGEKAATLAIDGLYPNPASSQLNVALSSPARGSVTLQVVDMTGRVLAQQVKAIAEGSNTVSLNVAGLSNGSYILKVVNAETGAVSAKFSKQ